MIKAEKLDYRTITKALQDGHFYASQGPEIQELWYEDGEIHIVCAPAKRIAFTFGTRRTMAFNAESGEYLTYAHVPVAENSIYVRVTVTDENGKPANTNAYFVDELNQ